MTERWHIDRMQLPWVESPFFEAELERRVSSDAEATLARRYHDDGYVVFDLELDDFEDVARRIIDDLAPRYEGPDRRVLDGWGLQQDVRRLATLPKVLETLEFLYGREPVPFQTLNFDVGTEQRLHSDVVHFDSIPRRFMCGVWIALEDMDENNGPLVYCPGSHRLADLHFSEIGLPPLLDAYPYYEQFVEQLVDGLGLTTSLATIRKGQALVWSANLLHGGSDVREEGRTRHSQVTHYYFEGCTYWMPRLSQFPGRLRVRETVDVRTGDFVPQSYFGEPIDLDSLELTWRYERPLPPGFTGNERRA